jgi:LysM repeat protein
MTNFVKARLCELGANDQPVKDTQFDVQFNPTSLRMSISNRTAGGQQAGSQTRQRPGTGDIQVSFDLVFDTADEGTTEQPVPVTKKTQMVEKFVRAPKDSSRANAAPPRVQFEWGTFQVKGVMDSASVDIDLFSWNGTPLRAKVAVSIKVQDKDLVYKETNGGATNAGGASPANARQPPPGAPGTQGGSDAPSKVVPAMPGESLQQLAARNGLDPSAWRALAQNIANPLALPPGLEIALPSTLVGGARGVTGNAGATFDASGTTASVPLVSADTLPSPQGGTGSGARDGRPADAVRAGQALAQQGGVSKSIAQARIDAQRGAVDAARGAYGMPPRDDTAARQDRRAYGSGIPLRPPRGDARGEPPMTYDQSTPGWSALRVRMTPRGRPVDRRRPVDACHCDCPGGTRRPTMKG